MSAFLSATYTTQLPFCIKCRFVRAFSHIDYITNYTILSPDFQSPELIQPYKHEARYAVIPGFLMILFPAALSFEPEIDGTFKVFEVFLTSAHSLSDIVRELCNRSSVDVLELYNDIECLLLCII